MFTTRCLRTSAAASVAGAPASLGALLAPAPVPARPGLAAAVLRGPRPLRERPRAVRRIERTVERRVAMRAPPRAQAGAVPPQAGLHCAVSLAQRRPLADLGLSNLLPPAGALEHPGSMRHGPTLTGPVACHACHDDHQHILTAHRTRLPLHSALQLKLLQPCSMPSDACNDAGMH